VTSVSSSSATRSGGAGREGSGAWDPSAGPTSTDNTPRPADWTAANDLLPYLPSDRDYDLPPEWWYN